MDVCAFFLSLPRISALPAPLMTDTRVLQLLITKPSPETTLPITIHLLRRQNELSNKKTLSTCQKITGRE